jgi:hypothetical protein
MIGGGRLQPAAPDLWTFAAFPNEFIVRLLK